MRTVNGGGNRAIRSICGHSRWLGDGEPTWIEGSGRRWERQARTGADARRLRERTARLLRRHDSGGEATALADRLDRCTRSLPCASGACPVCARAVQRWFVTTAGELLRGAPNGGTAYMASIVPDYGRFALSELGEIDVNRVVTKTLRHLKSAGVVLALGATDFSINVDTAAVDPYLQVQLTLFMPSKVGLLNRDLRQALKMTTAIKRPLKVQSFDGNSAGLAYALKYEFVLRKTYFQKSDNRFDGRRCQNSRNRILRGEKWAALMVLLDRIGLHNRLALLGAKRINQKGG